MARGDHIRVRRWGGLYTHHGIDLGDGTVVHLAGEPLRRRQARVCRTSMAEFLIDGALEIVEHRPVERPPDEIVDAALARLDESGYDVWRNNCEHFANFCATGRKESGQVTFVKRAAKVAASVAAAAIVLTGAMALSARRGRNRSHASKT